MSVEDKVIQWLIELGMRQDPIRVIILASSRTNSSAICDVFSDYDVTIYASDPTSFGASDAWFESFGPVLATYREGPSQRYGGYTRLVLYEDGTKIDLGVTRLDDLLQYSRTGTLPPYYDIGYQVLLDKDGVAASLKPPTYQAFIPKPPAEAEYASLLNDFWWDSTYVAKYLWRDDLMAVKFMLDHLLIHTYMRQMLEWSIEIDRGWSWKPGHYGRNIGRALDPEIYRELADVYAGGDIDDLWASLSRAIVLFRKAAVRVGENLGYEYPYDLDARVCAYHLAVKKLDRQATSRDDLTSLLAEAFRELTPAK